MSFCVRCGKECETPAEGLCIDCFLDGRKLLSMPHHVNLQICTNCGEFNIHDRWVQEEKGIAIEDIAIDTLGVSRDAKVREIGVMIQEQDDSNYVANVQATLDVYGAEITEDISVIVRIKNAVCKRCSRFLGDYYESILQIRSGDKDVPDDLREEVLDNVRRFVENQAKTNRDIFITKIERVVGGADAYLSSIQLGKILAKHLSEIYSAEVKESSKLVGQTRDGLDMYRVTYLVRLPDFHVGDVVEYEKRTYVLTRVANTGGRLVDLANFRERSIKRTEPFQGSGPA